MMYVTGFPFPLVALRDVLWNLIENPVGTLKGCGYHGLVRQHITVNADLKLVTGVV